MDRHSERAAVIFTLLADYTLFTLPAAQVCAHVRDADAVVYGMGSLYTSIAPSLILRGVGEAVAERACPKVLLLNGCHDRETSRCVKNDGPMHAVRF